MFDDRVPVRVYRWLLNLYPAAFRDEYAAVMEREIRDELTEAEGAWARIILWMRLLADLAVSIPLQIAREAWLDTTHALRLWFKSPWQTAFVIVALAIGIGANTGVFSVINALLLRSLPFKDSGSLAAVQVFQPPHDSSKQFHDWATHTSYLADAAAYEDGDFNIGAPRDVIRAHMAQVSSNFFKLLGMQPLLGRTFSPGEDTSRRNAVAVIGYGLWQELFAGDERVLGSTIRFDGAPLTIVGVAPSGFDYPNKTVLWRAAAFSPGNMVG